MTQVERVDAVRAVGFTERQAEFLVCVMLHSGYCLRRQYEAFAGIRYGKNVRVFFDRLTTGGLATTFDGRADRGHLYHIHNHGFYQAIGIDDSRQRRPASAAAITRRLMMLDAIIARCDVTWYATAAEKAELFVDTYRVPPIALPRAWRRVTPGYVAQTLPVFVPTVGEAPHFLYITTDDRPAAFETFLRRHAPVWRYLSSWAVVLVSIALRPTLQATFNRFVEKLASTQPSARPDIQWYFEKRRLIDNGELAKISVVDLPRFRDLRARFQSRANDALYDDWLRTGSIVADAPGSPTGDSIGTLITDLMPFAYEQFGSLPGVA